MRDKGEEPRQCEGSKRRTGLPRGFVQRHTYPVRIPESFARYELLPLSDTQVQELVLRYAEAVRLPRQGADALLHVVKSEPALSELTRSPLLVSAIVKLFASTAGIPSSREGILIEMTDTLASRWDAVRSIHRLPLHVDLLWQILGRMAYDMLERECVSIGYNEFVEFVRQFTGVVSVASQVLSVPILRQLPDRSVEFVHAVFRDVCAARFAARDPELRARTLERASQWPDVVALLREL